MNPATKIPLSPSPPSPRPLRLSISAFFRTYEMCWHLVARKSTHAHLPMKHFPPADGNGWPPALARGRRSSAGARDSGSDPESRRPGSRDSGRARAGGGGAGVFSVAVRLRDGRIAAVLRGGGPHLSIHGRLDMIFSSDEGETWSKPVLVDGFADR